MSAPAPTAPAAAEKKPRPEPWNKGATHSRLASRASKAAKSRHYEDDAKRQLLDRWRQRGRDMASYDVDAGAVYALAPVECPPYARDAWLEGYQAKLADIAGEKREVPHAV